jgi:hypothetical protein
VGAARADRSVEEPGRPGGETQPNQTTGRVTWAAECITPTGL